MPTAVAPRSHAPCGSARQRRPWPTDLFAQARAPPLRHVDPTAESTGFPRGHRAPFGDAFRPESRCHTGVASTNPLSPVNLGGGGPAQRCRHVGVTEATRPDDAEPWHGRAKDDASSSRALPLLFTEESVYVVTP
ncbi:hypothetical protein MTO96_001018 [Rhipicephalus appendiculatus]